MEIVLILLCSCIMVHCVDAPQFVQQLCAGTPVVSNVLRWCKQSCSEPPHVWEVFVVGVDGQGKFLEVKGKSQAKVPVLVRCCPVTLQRIICTGQAQHTVTRVCPKVLAVLTFSRRRDGREWFRWRVGT